MKPLVLILILFSGLVLIAWAMFYAAARGDTIERLGDWGDQPRIPDDMKHGRGR